MEIRYDYESSHFSIARGLRAFPFRHENHVGRTPEGRREKDVSYNKTGEAK